MFGKRFIQLSLAGLAMATAAGVQARDTINIVGSSTVYPFATVVAERFGANSDYPTPKIESTGSGGGMKIFCQGVGLSHPDITNASRRMKPSEFELCQGNGVGEITEFMIGSDGIVIASSRQAENLEITLKQLFLALGERVPAPDGSGELVDNPYKKWSEIDASLPDKPIRVLGPPPTSGTRDSFNELAMQGGCEQIPMMHDMDEERMETVCQSVRSGAFVEAGENDNLIVQKLVADTDSYGVFGYSFLEENSDRLQAARLNGVEPTPENIAEERYPVARSLYFYVKKAHVGVVPGIQEYVQEFVSPAAMGPNGYLKDVGLIVPPREQLMELMDKSQGMPSLTADALQ